MTPQIYDSFPSSAKLPQKYKYNAHNTTFLGMICDIIKVIKCASGWTHTKDMSWDRGVHGEFINGLA
jgi:hypothetical protein